MFFRQNVFKIQLTNLLSLQVTFSASFAFMFPSGTPPNAIVFGLKIVKVWDMVSYFITKDSFIFISGMGRLDDEHCLLHTLPSAEPYVCQCYFQFWQCECCCERDDKCAMLEHFLPFHITHNFFIFFHNAICFYFLFSCNR